MIADTASFDADAPYISAKCAEISPVINPRADNDSTIWSTSVSRRCRFRTILGLKLRSVSAAVDNQCVNAEARSNIRYQWVLQGALLAYIYIYVRHLNGGADLAGWRWCPVWSTVSLPLCWQPGFLMFALSFAGTRRQL